MKIYAIVPAFNEAANIANVVADISKAVPGIFITVIDDGSRDNTAQIAKLSGAIVLRLPHNLGIGGAVQTGLRFATLCNADYVVRLDGDGQHPAENIPLLLEPVMSGELDIAIGSRFCSGATTHAISFPRQVGIAVFGILTSMLSGQRVTDPTSGFMAMNARVASFLVRNIAQDYPEADARVMLSRGGFKIREIYTEMRERQGGVSSITPPRAFYYMFKVTLSVLAARTRIINQPTTEADPVNGVGPLDIPQKLNGDNHATISTNRYSGF
jgi:glycosyltransferase involved in cell wall biosynthesis